jgi:hypothetical protein
VLKRVCLTTVICFAAVLCAASLSVQVIDEYGSQVAARVYLSDSPGRAWFPGSALSYKKVRREASEQHFVPLNGSFDIDLPPGSYDLVIERGKEYIPVTERIKVEAGGKVRKTFRLRRWIDMKARGWYSGDMHLHRRLRDMPVLLEAEDLNAGIPITRWRLSPDELQEDPDLSEFLSKADGRGVIRLPNRRWFTVLNEELESASSALLISMMGRKPGGLEYPIASYARAARLGGALVDAEKPTSLEFPVIAALGGCELVGLANNHFWRSGYFLGEWGAWPNDGLRPYPQSCAGVALAGFELYYALLNMGFPLRPSAGSASGVHTVPPGWSRVYAHMRGEFSPAAWIEAVRQGRTFVTTGPMLFLKVSGLEPGEHATVARFPVRADIELRLYSLEAVTAAEIVINGLVHTVKLHPATSAYLYEGRMRAMLEESSWIAARWIRDRGRSCDLAHTAPVYFFLNKDVRLRPHPEEVRFFVRAVEKLIAEAEVGGPRIPAGTEAIRSDTIRQFREALGVYRSRGLELNRRVPSTGPRR